MESQEDTTAAIIERRVTHTETSLLFAEDTSFEEWQEAYAFYDRLHERGKWWLGDAIKFAEGKFPDRYTQAIEITGLSYSRLTTIVSVCGKIEPARRRPEANFAMHELIAYIPYQKGDYLLDRAIKEHWSRDELADAVAKSQGEPTRAEKAAAKLAKKSGSTVKELPLAANPPPVIDISATVEKAYIWNGYPVTVNGGVLSAGEILPPDEAERCAHEHKFADAQAMVEAITPATPPASQEAPQQHSEPVSAPTEPKAPAGPTASAIEPDQNVAITRCEAALNRFLESIPAVDWSQVSPLKRKTWLKNMEPIDVLIDLLQLPPAAN